MVQCLINVIKNCLRTQLVCGDKNKCITLHRVFHGIRLLRLIKIGCRETINFFMPSKIQLSAEIIKKKCGGLRFIDYLCRQINIQTIKIK